MSLRLLHTSDWHLGRALFEESLLRDQEWVLDRLLEALRDTRPDALVVAGDVYDRAVPAADAVKLLDDVLFRVAGLGIPVVAIAGNHDSPERLSFGSRLLEASGVHLRGGLDDVATPVAIPGKGFVYAVPFVDPDVVRGMTGEETLRGHAAATDRILAAVRADAAGRTLPTVLVAHAFAQGARETKESERPISVGNAGSVPAGTLGGFDYVALGHLHEPQEVAAGIRYSGSLLKYSFAEAAHVKGAFLVEVERGAARVEQVRLGQRRDLARIQGSIADLLLRPDLARHQGDLVEVMLEDEGYVFDARARLQARFPHVMNVRRRDAAPAGETRFVDRVAGAAGDDQALFRAFLETVAGAPPTGAQADCFASAVEEVARKERAS